VGGVCFFGGGRGVRCESFLSVSRPDDDKAEKIVKYTRPYNTNTAHVECQNVSYTSNNRGSWNHLKIIQIMLERHTGEARYEGTEQHRKAVDSR